MQPSLFNPQVDPFVRSSDPHTSREAAQKRSRKIGPEHLFCLKHHANAPDSDANAGFACLEAGLVSSQEIGRRASRTIREDLNWTENLLDPASGRYLTVPNRNSNREGKQNFLTDLGRNQLPTPDFDF